MTLSSRIAWAFYPSLPACGKRTDGWVNEQLCKEEGMAATARGGGDCGSISSEPPAGARQMLDHVTFWCQAWIWSFLEAAFKSSFSAKLQPKAHMTLSCLPQGCHILICREFYSIDRVILFGLRLISRIRESSSYTPFSKIIIAGPSCMFGKRFRSGIFL